MYEEKLARLNTWLEAEPSRMEEWVMKWEMYEDDGIEVESTFRHFVFIFLAKVSVQME